MTDGPAPTSARPATVTEELFALGVLTTLAVLAFPFALIGLLYAHRSRIVVRPRRGLAVAFVVMCAGVAASGVGSAAPFAFFRALLASEQLPAAPGWRLPWSVFWSQAFFEGILGIPLYAAVLIARDRILGGSVRYRHDARDARRRRVERLMIDPSECTPDYTDAHPLGHIRVGYRIDDGSQVNVPISALGVGGGGIGQPGMGKTLLIANLIDGLAASTADAPCLVMVVDGKDDASLRERLRGSAARYGLPFYELSGSPSSQLYDPIGDSPPEMVVAKILATMDFGANAAIYRDISGHALGMIVSALREVGETASLLRIRQCFTPMELVGLAGRSADPDLKVFAAAAASKQRNLQTEAIAGMYHRLSRLVDSKYGRLLGAPNGGGASPLRLAALAESAGILYIGASTHGSGDDARLLVNVVLSDTGELAHARNNAIALGKSVTPIYLFVDEFAQLTRGGSVGETVAIEARLSNTFELARSSRISPFPAMQVLPDSEFLTTDLFAAGLLVLLRSPQAEDIAKRLGSVPGGTITHKLSPDGHATGTGEGSLTPEPEWAVSPDVLRRAAVGVGIVRIGNQLPVAVLLHHHSLRRTGAPRGWLRQLISRP